MQLGTRWKYGAQAPTSVPQNLLPAIAEVEAAADPLDHDGYWTLTWLESRAVLEFEDGTIIRQLEAEGFVIEQYEQD